MTHGLRLFICCVLLCPAQGFAQSGNRIFVSFFDPAPDAFRVTTMVIKEPHFFFQLLPPISPCTDFTDTPLPGVGISVNGGIADAHNGDSNEDGLLDAGALVLARPLATGAGTRPIDYAPGDCLAPVPTNGCAFGRDGPYTRRSYGTPEAGLCSAPLPGTTSVWSPAVLIETPSAPCLVSNTSDFLLELAGLALRLRAFDFAAGLDGPDVLRPMLLRGFLTEADANALIFPPGTPLAGRTVASLLPGGSGSCRADLPGGKDTFGGEPGWWFYVNGEATRVVYAGP